VAGHRLLRRLTLLVSDGAVEHVWYPVYPPDSHAAEVARWLREHDEPRRAEGDEAPAVTQ
jgi:peroxiredoxin